MIIRSPFSKNIHKWLKFPLTQTKQDKSDFLLRVRVINQTLIHGCNIHKINRDGDWQLRQTEACTETDAIAIYYNFMHWFFSQSYIYLTFFVYFLILLFFKLSCNFRSYYFFKIWLINSYLDQSNFPKIII